MRQIGAQQLFFFTGVVVGHTDECLVALGKQGAVHGVQHIDKQRVGKQGHQHRHLHTALRRQRTCGRVRNVPELLGGILHALHQFLRDPAFAPQCARGGDGTHAGKPSDIAQGGAPAGAASGIWFVQG